MSELNAEIQKYKQEREALISKEKECRHDYAYRQRLSDTGRRACEIVKKIREHEAETVWTKQWEESSGDAYPGMMFTLASARMEKTKLWQIVRKMPKGALLHAHFDAMIDMRWLIEQGLNRKGMKFFSDVSLTSAEARTKANVNFAYLPNEKGNTPTNPRKLDEKSVPVKNATASIWSDAYEAQSVVEASEAAESFPEGGREGFVKFLLSRMTITPEESLQHHEGLWKIWQKFSSTFVILGGILFYEPIFRDYCKRVFSQLMADGVRYADVRIAFVFTWRKENGEISDYHDFFRVFKEEIESFQATEEGKGFWGCRMIWTTLRIFPTDLIEESMKTCVSVKKAFPDIIAGFDLVGQEDLGRTLLDLLPELLWFKDYCKQENVDLPFFFHAGEVLGDGDKHDENLYDAVLLGTKRIGHGFSMYKHPHLIELIKERKICLEQCPISNEVLRLSSSILSHPLPVMLANGVPVALSNDDPGILGQGTTGVSHDFWQVLQGFENVGLAGLGDLVETSVIYAAFDGEEIGIVAPGGLREKRLAEIREEWEAFYAWIISEFGNAT